MNEYHKFYLKKISANIFLRLAFWHVIKFLALTSCYVVNYLYNGPKSLYFVIISFFIIDMMCYTSSALNLSKFIDINFIGFDGKNWIVSYRIGNETVHTPKFFICNLDFCSDTCFDLTIILDGKKANLYPNLFENSEDFIGYVKLNYKIQQEA